jgi:diaminohydroxyphosphoribosylaminopyrimidine deaminase/5-amino-6-(5-phosphoribosylamino)uracil reductase
MHRCIQLAKLAAGTVAPNPMVGAALVYDEKIIAEGYHKKFGEPHAEVNCVNNVKEADKHLIEKSTLYVSLEPCSHFGKTPPCTDLIIKNKIPKVVIGCKDVYKEVDGRGIKKLQDAGIEVTTGVLEKECKELNKRFFTFHQKQRPYVILKWAESVDGKIAGAGNERTMISNEYSNRLVHKWRSEEAAILIGKKTALKDDPSLTTRLWQGENPKRIVIDNNLSLPLSLKIFDGSAPTIVFNLLKQKAQKNIKWMKVNNGDLSTLLTSLHIQNIQSVIVEGGASLLRSFIDAGLWDEARIIRNDELVIGNGLDAPKLMNASFQKKEKLFTDTISYFLHA